MAKVIDKDKEKALLEANVWTTEKVNLAMKAIEEYGDSKNTPFWEGDPDWRSADVVFEYTPEELLEIQKCASDVHYFADNYCNVMTDNGIENIKLRDYQKDILTGFANHRFNILLSPRQSGKTISTSIFMAHYLTFNFDKNLMILANVGSTTQELVDKIKVVLKGLPFFLKPGVKINNVMTMSFDNGCRLFGKNTTKNPGIGFTIHFLYMDEFAHIHPNFLNKFYKSLYPTISSSKISRIIITSTPNGPNKFYEIYLAALEKKNTYNAMRIDWWQIPGRDEAWMKDEIANLGSIEDFNQEYGNQFFTSSKLLLDADSLKTMKKNITDYEHRVLSDFEDLDIGYDELKFHKSFDLDKVKETDKFVFTIDLAGGEDSESEDSDSTIINILKVIPSPIPIIQKKIGYKDESDFFSLLQVGLWRSNLHDLDHVLIVLETLIYKIFGEDNIKIVLEMNFDGKRLYDKMEKHKRFYEEIFIHTKHTENAVSAKVGVRLNVKSKKEYCKDVKKLVRTGRIIPTETTTYDEFAAFGLNGKGSYSSQIGHDDIAMTLVNLTVFFDSPQYYEVIEEIYDSLEFKYKKEIELKLANVIDDEDGDDYSSLKDLME